MRLHLLKHMYREAQFASTLSPTHAQNLPHACYIEHGANKLLQAQSLYGELFSEAVPVWPVSHIPWLRLIKLYKKNLMLDVWHGQM